MAIFSPKISIITVTYNAQKYIERTIHSIICQTYPNIEYVIIDGASKDDTLTILQKYKDHIDILISEPDAGLYDAMNKAMEHLTGEYLIFMNAGDQFADSHTLANAMEGAQGADLVYGLALKVDESGHSRPWHKQTPPPDQLSARSFLNGMVICHQCMVLKTQCAVTFNLKYSISADLDWSIRCMKRVRSVHFYGNQTFCLFLDGGVSDSGRLHSLVERLRILASHFGWAPAILHQFISFWRALQRGTVR